jgi:Mg/Co/Ni transporter MgtE
MLSTIGKWARRVKRWLTLPLTAVVLVALLLPLADIPMPDIIGLVGVAMILTQFAAGLFLYLLPYLSRRRKLAGPAPDAGIERP